MRRFTVYPGGVSRPIPPEVDDPYRRDFAEAGAVLSCSPKASAALSRRRSKLNNARCGSARSSNGEPRKQWNVGSSTREPSRPNNNAKFRTVRNGSVVFKRPSYIARRGNKTSGSAGFSPRPNANGGAELSAAELRSVSIEIRRKMRTNLILQLLLAGAVAATVSAQSPGSFTATGVMTMPRTWHTATLLTSGKVLIAGGEMGANGLTTAELYDPASGTFTPTGSMTMPHVGHTATLLPDGRVLIVGGSPVGQAFYPSRYAEVYDPSTGAFSVANDTIFGHACQQATLLGNGKVLITGGGANFARPVGPELYDPTTGAFASAGTYARGNIASGFNTCQGSVSTLLPDGRVLIVWESNDAELYDPNTGLFTSTGSSIGFCYCDGMPTSLAKHFKTMSAKRLFSTVADGAALWDLYLASVPPGANPVYKTRTEHDCGCCRHFIKSLGGVVNIVDGKTITLWDFKVDEPYQAVADAMAAYRLRPAIDNVYLHPQRLVGTANSRQLLEDKSVKTWEHYHVNLPDTAVAKKDLIGPGRSIAPTCFITCHRL